MPVKFNLGLTSTFERKFHILTKRDPLLQERLLKLVNILREDPYNLSKQHDIKKLTDAPIEEGQWRIRSGNYRIRYNIFQSEVVLYSVAHRKNSYS